MKSWYLNKMQKKNEHQKQKDSPQLQILKQFFEKICVKEIRLEINI